MVEDNFQQKIRDIQRDSTISSEDKNKKIRELMLNKNKSNIPKKKIKPKLDNKSILTKIKCDHYNRGCDIYCDLCNKYYPCRICHDSYEDHKIDRFKINKVRCRNCNYIQSPSQNCLYCHSIFGFYFCKTCNLWECNNKKIFHCDKCGICRIGRKQDYIHCDKCNMCIAVTHYNNNHKCVENSTKTNCPICNEYMFDSVDKPINILKCGHSIHEECFKNMLKKKQYKCPLCKKSIINMKEHWLAKDQLANLEMIPFSYMNKRQIIFCNDCEQKSDIKFSFDYKKCRNCNGYNTNEIETYDM